MFWRLFELQRGREAENFSLLNETFPPFLRAYGVLSFGKKVAARKRILSMESKARVKEKNACFPMPRNSTNTVT